MTSPRVLVEIDGAVAHVILNRPDKLNGVDLEMLRGLVAAATSLRRNREIRAVILRGNGDAFCAGLDFASVMERPAGVVRSFLPSPLRGTNLFQRAHWVWRELPVPVLAVVHGRCYGAGLQLAAAADFRYSTPDCEWSVLEAKWGLVPDMAGTVPLGELVAPDVAKRLTMTGEIVSGTRARELGLVSEVDENPLAAALSFVDVLATRSPDSVAASKKLLNETRGGRPRRAFRIERRLQFAMLRSANAKIARTANFAKRDPEFGPRKWRR
ncbi:crotonase/enoyl-CoA hydratase family protein [Rhodococcus kronopolitis]|uniref:Crotonase/enoyl-CoA hydratase family protein n=1 Tax=Rhodococcus kronopolitis TaxID=1460226 RepID=A0ABV9FPQ5_9NOCA